MSPDPVAWRSTRVSDVGGGLMDFGQYPRRLNLGCGFDRQVGYLNIDINGFHDPDLVADVRDLSVLPSGYYEEILAIDVLEHIGRTEVKGTLAEWNRLLVEGGILTIRVPDLVGLLSLFFDRHYRTLEKQEELVQCCFGTQAYQGDFHLSGFTPTILRNYLESAGFSVVRMRNRDVWLIEAVARKGEGPAYGGPDHSLTDLLHRASIRARLMFGNR